MKGTPPPCAFQASSNSDVQQQGQQGRRGPRTRGGYRPATILPNRGRGRGAQGEGTCASAAASSAAPECAVVLPILMVIPV